ncbi:MAG: hypothetical protein CMJ77_06160 [Planctomycetaceae bacterium]|nr:hypothetical protein [Planctomycetaceae bacterium]
MKTERRHELQNNELAAWLTVWIEKIQPYLKTVLGVLILGLVIILGIFIVQNREQQATAQAWSAYFNAYGNGNDTRSRNPEEFKDVSETYPQTPPGMWAMQSAGDLDLTSGAIQLFRDRDAGRDELQNAVESYEKIATTTNDPMLKPRAIFGWGQALEALGEIEAARKKYEQVVTGAEEGGEFEGSVVAELASQRVSALDQPATQAWYGWFAEQKPIQSPLSNQGLFENMSLPDDPDINLPQPGNLIPGTLPENESSTDTSDATDGPTLFDPAETTNPPSESTDTPAADNSEAVIDIETEASDPAEASESEAPPAESETPSTDSE